jgi:hypothetical protein
MKVKLFLCSFVLFGMIAASVPAKTAISSDTHQMMVLKYLFEELKKLQLALMVFHSQNCKQA